MIIEHQELELRKDFHVQCNKTFAKGFFESIGFFVKSLKSLDVRSTDVLSRFVDFKF
jgi:hypothetical protein